MANWIAEVHGVAFHLEEISVTIDDEDLILVLTMGLPKSFDTFVISLDTDTTPLTLNHVITRLLNEESQQTVDTRPVHEHDPSLAATTFSSEKPGSHTGGRCQNTGHSLAHITCYKCGQKGHFQANCPNHSASLSQPSSTNDTHAAHTAFYVDDLEEQSESENEAW